MKRVRKWIAALLAVCTLLGLLAGCGKGSESEDLKEKALSAQSQTQAQPEQTVPESTEPIEITDAVSLAKVSLQEIDRTTPWVGYVDNQIEFSGILGLPNGEYFAEMEYDVSLTFGGEDWMAHRYLSTKVGKTYESSIEEYQILKGKQYYLKHLEQKAYTVGTGVVPTQPVGIPCVTVLEQVAAGTLSAQYSASPEEGHFITVSLSGNDLKQFLSEIFVEFVAEIPNTADWSGLTGDIRITFNSYNRRPDKVIVTCPELLSLYMTTAVGALYMNVEESEIYSSISYSNGIYESSDLAMAVPGTIPAPTTMKDLIAKAAQNPGNPLGPVKTDDSQTVPAPQEPETSAPASDPAQPAAEPTQPAAEPTQPAAEPTQPAAEPTQPAAEPTQPASDGFVPPESFEVIDTTDDITLYWDDGSHVTISYPSGTKLFDNCRFHQGGTYYAMITHDIFFAGGYTKFTLMDIGDKESYLDKKRDSYRSNISATENLLSSEVGDIQTVTVNGMEVSYFTGSYEVINLLGKQVTSIDYYAVAEVGGSFLCLEFNLYPSKSYPELDFSPVELLYGCVKP